jgi:hypothetical protein
MHLRSKRLAAATSVVVLSLGLTACGGDDDATSDSVGSSTADAPRTVAGGESDLTKDSFFTSVSDAQNGARTSHVAMTIGTSEQTITAEGDVEVGATIADTSMAVTMDMSAAGLGEIDLRLVDEVFYIDLGEMTGGKFAKSDLDDPDDPIARQFGSLSAQFDPAKQLASFGDAVKSFKRSGDAEQIDGVQAQPYEMVLDTESIAGMSGLVAGGGLPETLTYTMFIGPDNLPRRVTADIATGSFTLDYSRWGEEVDIQAPGDDEISDVDLGELATS